MPTKFPSIVVEGPDRSGKNLCINQILSSFQFLQIYPENDAIKRIFVKGTPEYHAYLRGSFVSKMNLINGNIPSILDRFYMSEIVYSKVMHRISKISSIPVFEENFSKPLLTIYLSLDYDVYLQRCHSDIAEEPKIYTQNEFDMIISGYESAISISKFPVLRILNNYANHFDFSNKIQQIIDQLRDMSKSS